MTIKEDGIRAGSAYSNGNFGSHWSVRQVLSTSADCDGAEAIAADCISYKVLAGAGRRGQGVCTREEFLHWARYEVARDENSWVQVGAILPW